MLTDQEIITKIFHHIDHQTTDMGDTVWREPVEHYHCPKRFEQEMKLMRRLPIPFCPSAALPNPGDYVARDAAGTPLLVVRGRDGQVRGFRNACRHRGMPVVENAQGHKPSFTCRYHAWSYGLDGALMHVPGGLEEGFPGCAQKDMGLQQVFAVQEFGGLVFITQDEPVSEGALGGLKPLFDPEQVVFNCVEFVDDTNWKLIGETSMEGYHIKALHKESFYPYGYDNLNIVSLYGMNSRIIFPFRRVEKLRDKPQDEWRLQGMVTDVYQMFPNTHVTVLSNHSMLIILDPISPTQTRWIVYQLSPKPIDGKVYDLEKIKKDANFVQDTGLVEDREAAAGILRHISSGANDVFTFGRFEQAICHFHHHLTDQLARLG